MGDCLPTAQEGTFVKPEHTDVTVLPPYAHESSDCRGVASILARVGDKWSLFVIMLLGNGPRRFNEIKRMVGGISQRMLTLTLRGLERDGLVTRTVVPTTPPRFDRRNEEADRVAGKINDTSPPPWRSRRPASSSSRSTVRTIAGEASAIR